MQAGFNTVHGILKGRTMEREWTTRRWPEIDKLRTFTCWSHASRALGAYYSSSITHTEPPQRLRTRAAHERPLQLQRRFRFLRMQVLNLFAILSALLRRAQIITCPVTWILQREPEIQAPAQAAQANSGLLELLLHRMVITLTSALGLLQRARWSINSISGNGTSRISFESSDSAESVSNARHERMQRANNIAM